MFRSVGPGLWRQIAYVVVGLVVGGVSLFLALDGVEGHAVFVAMRAVRVGWLILAVLGVVLVALLKAARWYHLLAPDHQAVDWRALLAILLVAQVSNVVVPLRGVGEMVRVALTARCFSISALRVGGTIVTEKLVDLLALGAIGLASAPAVGRVTSGLALAVRWWPLGAGLVLLFLVSLSGGVHAERSCTSRLGRWLLATGHLDQLSTGFSALRSRAGIWRLAAWTVAVWAISLAVLVCTLQATRVFIPLWGGVLMLLLLHLGFLLPTPPGLIGLVQVICVQVLAFFDVSRSQAFSTGVVLHLVLVVPLLLCAAPAWFCAGRELL